jgi:dipeptidyl aminopeptidase/acylaminoacyl peptidase
VDFVEDIMVAAVTSKTISKEDLFRLQCISGAALSPDGTRVLYAVLHVDTNKDKEFSTLYLLDLTSGETRQMTASGSSASGPVWSLDGTHFAFVSDRGEKPQIYVMPADGGEAQVITQFKQGVSGGLNWSPDGQQIAFTAGPQTDEPFDFSKPYRITRKVYRFDVEGYLDQAVRDIYVVPAHGGNATRITSDGTMNANPIWSPDSREILFLTSMYPDSFDAYYPGIRIANLNGEIRDLLGDWGKAHAANWTPDGRRIVFVGLPRGLTIGSKSDLFVMPSAGGTPENRTDRLPYHTGSSLQADFASSGFGSSLRLLSTNDTTIVRVQIGGTVQIYRVGLSGTESCEAIVKGDQMAFPIDLVDGTLLYGVSRMNDPMHLALCNDNGQKARFITTINGELLADYALPESEHLLFDGVDGVQVEGWYIKPPRGQAPYPTILYIHGGPHSAFGHTYSFDFQLLAGSGYGVLIVNHRASTGYGNAFATAIKGDWGNLDYHDLMSGVDEAIARGLADADRLGVCGLSGGGNLSCWTIGQTDRFKAAIPENPVTNWVSFYGVSDIGVWFAVEQMGGHPHEIPDVYARCSPITYAHRCTTPTLLVQAEQDYRCPAEQSEQFYNVLNANGCPVEMLRYRTAHTAAPSTGRSPAAAPTTTPCWIGSPGTSKSAKKRGVGIPTLTPVNLHLSGRCIPKGSSSFVFFRRRTQHAASLHRIRIAVVNPLKNAVSGSRHFSRYPLSSHS